VADLTTGPPLLEQIRLVAGLRWRILRNGLRRKSSQWDLLGTVLFGILAAFVITGASFGFFFGAYQLVSSGHVSWLALLFWAIFIFWQVFPVFSAGFGAGFEFRNILRFPLSRRAFYIIGLAYGLADFSAVAGTCWLIAMAFGATTADLVLLPSLLLISFVFLLMNLTLERMIGSWLERLLARRRAREIFFALFLLFAVSAQFISPLLQRYGRSAQPWFTGILPYLGIFPPALAGRAVAGAAAYHFRDVLIGVAGIAAYALVFSVFLWIRFAAQYRGEELSETAAPVAHPISRAVPQLDALRLLNPQVASVLRKEFRYLTRNAFSFFLLIMPLAFVLLFSTQFSGRHPTAVKHAIGPDVFFPGMMGYLILILMGPAYNCFAFDGRGVQAYFICPLSFRTVFLGKNLMQVAISFFELAASMVCFAYIVGLPSPPVFFATLAAILFVVSGQLAVANWSSLNFPRKLNFGQMRGQRQSGMGALCGLAAQLLFGAISAPILFLSRWTRSPWLPTEVFGFLALAAIIGYFSSLDPLARLAENKKETLIEALCR
jgi:ABC-2 type transport system permease protein